MKIPKQLHQFARGTSLIIVAGKQDALLYSAHEGEVTLVDSLKISRPHYSDNEGLSKARSHNGGSIRSGTAKEMKDQFIISDFIKELKGHIHKVRSDMYTEAYVLAPAKTKNEIVDALPHQLQQKVRSVVEGNFYHSSPLEVIKKIQAIGKSASQSYSQSNEEKHIREIGELAHSVSKTEY